MKKSEEEFFNTEKEAHYLRECLQSDKFQKIR